LIAAFDPALFGLAADDDDGSVFELFVFGFFSFIARDKQTNTTQN
jgi:hypothetical protein